MATFLWVFFCYKRDSSPAKNLTKADYILSGLCKNGLKKYQ